MAIFQKTIQGLINDVTYYTRVFPINPKGAAQSELGGQWNSCVPAAFPNEPTTYELIDTYTTSTTFTAPEDGWYQIELHGASGNGGSAIGPYFNDKSCAGGGGGGGGSGCSISRVKLNKDDTIVLTSIAVGSTAVVYINSSIEVYSNMLCASGANGARATNKGTTPYGGTGGSGGVGSGGNYANYTGGTGGTGGTAKTNTQLDEKRAYGGSGGTPGYTGGNVGGNGGAIIGRYDDSKTSPGSGKTAFMKIYRGNTNLA